MAASPAKVEKRRVGKHDAFVTEKLGDAVARIRTLELTLGFCGLFVGFLVYGQLAALLDMRFGLPEVVRQLLLGLFLGVAGVWCYLFIYRPWRLGINPYYAAQVIESNTPDAQNGTLNWLDMQKAPEATHARPLVGARAAKELSKADLEKAISGEKATWSGIAAVLLFLLAPILALIVGPRDFMKSLGRVLFPYSQAAATSTAPTTLSILYPEGGDGVVLVGQPAVVRVKLDGRIPSATDRDAAKLRFRAGEDEPWSERPLRQLDDPAVWEGEIPSELVQNGIDYHVTAGNGTSPTHRIAVEAAPLIEEFKATYHFRQYTGRTFEVRRDRAIDALRGTVVDLRVKTNRPLAAKTPQLVFDVNGVQQILPGTILEKDPTTFTVKMTLEESGKYTLQFAPATRRGTYRDAMPYDVTARPDALPEVELTHPARDVVLPANGMLPLEGWATDVEGVKRLILRLRVIGGGNLKALPYRDLDTLRQKFGTYPTYVKYKDFIDLTKLRDEAGKEYRPKVGEKLEYWLEAADACDLPGTTRVVPSKRYRIEITDPDPDMNGQGEQRKQAAQDKANHDKQQDQQFAQEDAGRKEENDRKEKDGQGGTEDKPGENGQQGQKQGGQGQQNQDDQNTLKEAERIKDELKKNEQKEGQGGKGKDQKQEQGGESKEGGEKQEQKGESKEGAQGEQKEQAGQGKEQGKDMAQNPPAEKKDGGMPDKGENKPEGKEGGQQGMMGQQQGESKPGEKQGENKPGQGKEQQPGQGGQASEQKPGMEPGMENAAQGKENGGMGKETAAERKDPPQPNAQPSEGKEGGQPSDMQAAPSGKEQGNQAGMGEQKPGEQKPRPEGQTQGTASKPGANDRPANDPREARPEDVEKLKNQAAESAKGRREAAGKELDRIQKQANDPAVREKAKEALEEMKQQGQPSQCKKPGGTGMGMAEGGAENKPGAEGMPGGEGGKPAVGMGQGQKAEAKEPGPENMGGMGGNPMPGDNRPMGKEQGMMPGGGNEPGMGVERAQGDPNGMGQGGNNPEVKPEQAAPAPPTELQLQKFKDAVNKDVLKDLRMSPEEFERFLKKYEELAKRPGNATEKVPASQPGTGTLPAIGGNTTTGQPGTQPTGPGLQTRPQAPPGYREANKEFLRLLSQPEKP